MSPRTPSAEFQAGIRAAITWLHEEAKRMNDPHARSILNDAAFHLGVNKPVFVSTPPPDPTTNAELIAEADEARNFGGNIVYVSTGVSANHLYGLITKLLAALQETGGEMVLVPREPTDAMWMAGIEAFTCSQKRFGLEGIREAYCAMIKATGG